MGLDFTHCEAHWSYSGFHNFRQRLWDQLHKEYSIPTDDLIGMYGFGGDTSWDLFPADDPMRVFMNHSDCDGVLSPLECSAIAPRLKTLIADWDEDDWDRNSAEELIAGMELAADCNEDLEFC